jgi:hypothetical protein
MGPETGFYAHSRPINQKPEGTSRVAFDVEIPDRLIAPFDAAADAVLVAEDE